MTLVLETSPGSNPAADASISNILQQYNFSPADAPQIFGEHAFHYFHSDTGEAPATITAQLMQLPGVHSAYVKPDGAPPSL